MFATQQSSHLAILKDVFYSLNIWLADGFMVSDLDSSKALAHLSVHLQLYRAFVIWGGGNISIVLPLLTYLGSVGRLFVQNQPCGALF